MLQLATRIKNLSFKDAASQKPSARSTQCNRVKEALLKIYRTINSFSLLKLFAKLYYSRYIFIMVFFLYSPNSHLSLALSQWNFLPVNGKRYSSMVKTSFELPGPTGHQKCRVQVALKPAQLTLLLNILCYRQTPYFHDIGRRGALLGVMQLLALNQTDSTELLAQFFVVFIWQIHIHIIPSNLCKN